MSSFSEGWAEVPCAGFSPTTNAAPAVTPTGRIARPTPTYLAATAIAAMMRSAAGTAGPMIAPVAAPALAAAPEPNAQPASQLYLLPRPHGTTADLPGLDI